MQTQVSETATSHAEFMLGELEILRDEANKLEGDARKRANQQANDLADAIERLEFQTRIAGSENEQRASGALKLLKKAWANLEQNIHSSTKDVQRELEEQH